MRNTITLSAVILIAFSIGFAVGHRRLPETSFHDIIVNHSHDLSGLITPGDSRVRILATQLQTPENAYRYVRDRIANDPSLPALPAGDIIEEKIASCLGKAALLCSLYRAMGVPASDVRVVTGELAYPDAIVDHAWVDMEYNDLCLQQDATDFIGTFAFDQFTGMDYTRQYIRKEGYAFNDEHFAVVSRLNMLKGTGHPVIP